MRIFGSQRIRVCKSRANSVFLCGPPIHFWDPLLNTNSGPHQMVVRSLLTCAKVWGLLSATQELTFSGAVEFCLLPQLSWLGFSAPLSQDLFSTLHQPKQRYGREIQVEKDQLSLTKTRLPFHSCIAYFNGEF